MSLYGAAEFTVTQAHIECVSVWERERAHIAAYIYRQMWSIGINNLSIKRFRGVWCSHSPMLHVGQITDVNSFEQ